MRPNSGTQERLFVGQETFVSQVPEGKDYGVVFEDDGETAYFYAVAVSPDKQTTILDTLHIYNVADVQDRHKPSLLQIIWSEDLLKAALLINDYPHAVFDFAARRGYCRSNYPPPDSNWTQFGHEWDDNTIHLFTDSANEGSTAGTQPASADSSSSAGQPSFILRLVAWPLILTVIGGGAVGTFVCGKYLWRRFRTSSSDSEARVAATLPITTETVAQPSAQEWQNSLGMKFIRVNGLFFSVWETRVQDFETFVSETGYQATTDVVGIGRFGRWKKNGETWQRPGFNQTAEHPVVAVSGDDAMAFCKWLTAREQKSGMLTAQQHYRLPTFQEWAQAAGADEFPWGSQWPPPDEAGNYPGEEATSANPPLRRSFIKGHTDRFINTSPVGRFPANAHGLFDLGGNAWEFCTDSSGAVIVAGGSCYTFQKDRLARAHKEKASWKSSGNDRGFRCVLDGK